jgi:hypothetical protein
MAGSNAVMAYLSQPVEKHTLLPLRPRRPERRLGRVEAIGHAAVRAELRNSNDFNGESDKRASFAPLNRKENNSPSDTHPRGLKLVNASPSD